MLTISPVLGALVANGTTVPTVTATLSEVPAVSRKVMAVVPAATPVMRNLPPTYCAVATALLALTGDRYGVTPPPTSNSS